MIKVGITRLLQGPPISGWAALLVTAGALAIPTSIRAAMTGAVTGCEFTPYLPFVLLTSILVGWRQAAAVAVASAAILGGVIVGQPNAPFDKSCFISGAGIFLAASAMILGIVVAARHAGRDADESTGGIRFSLDQGDVWASWYGQSPPVRLGSQRSVAEMMEDFLSQSERGNSSDPS